MGIFRRSGSTPGDEPVAGHDGESGETVEEQWPLGPTGRPLHPVGAYFEAAFPDLEYTWLPTEGGDDRIVLMERDALP